MTLDDVKNIIFDFALPIDYAEAYVTQVFVDSEGKDIEVKIPAVSYAYHQDQMSLAIDDVHHTRGEMYALSTIPLFYAPYFLLEAYLDLPLAPANAYTLILKDDANLDDIRSEVQSYDEELIVFYLYKKNLTYIAENEAWLHKQMKSHIVTTLICVLAVAGMLMLLETLNKNDYLYLRYSGLAKERYIQYRLIEGVVMISLMSVSSIIYANFFKRLVLSLPTALMTYGIFIIGTILLYYLFIHYFYKHLKI